VADAADHNLPVAATSAVPVLATGLLAWQFQLVGQSCKAFYDCIWFLRAFRV
jgi:hypothetical protein